jgi:hypothetical protein
VEEPKLGLGEEVVEPPLGMMAQLAQVEEAVVEIQGPEQAEAEGVLS